MVSDKSIADKIAYHLGSGYWKVNNHFFFSKVDCLRYATQIQDFNVSFHYNDEFFSTIDTKVEPAESLESLYKERALQLREKYDFLILSFSGGSDSYNVLNTFIKNNIHLDCIATSYPIQAIENLKGGFSPLDRRAENIIFEFTEVADPILKKVSKKSPNTEICVLDHTSKAINMIMDGKLNQMSIGGIGAAPGLAGHMMIGEKAREYNDRGSVALITGVDKPRLGYSPVTKKFGSWFDDISSALGNYTGELFNGYNPKVEHFYYTTDFPKLWQKQCHTLKNALIPILDQEVKPDNFKRMHIVNAKGNIVFYVHNIFFKKLLYNGWSENIFQATKPSGYFFQEHSDWYLNSPLTSEREKEFHYKQVMELIHGIDPKFIVYNEKGKPLRFADMNGPVYPI